MFALPLPYRQPNLCSAIRATLGQRQICQSPGLALNAHSGNEWGKIPVLTGDADEQSLMVEDYVRPVGRRSPRSSLVHAEIAFVVACRQIVYRPVIMVKVTPLAPVGC